MSKMSGSAWWLGVVVPTAFVVTACVGDNPSSSVNSGSDAAVVNDGGAADGSGPNGCTLCVFGSGAIGNCCVK